MKGSKRLKKEMKEMKEIEEISNKIQKISEKMKKLKNLKIDLEDERRSEIIKKYPILYVVECIATGDEDYLSYKKIQSCYTTKAKAEDAFGNNEDYFNIRHYSLEYRIRPAKSETISDPILDNLDKITYF